MQIVELSPKWVIITIQKYHWRVCGLDQNSKKLNKLKKRIKLAV